MSRKISEFWNEVDDQGRMSEKAEEEFGSNDYGDGVRGLCDVTAEFEDKEPVFHLSKPCHYMLDLIHYGKPNTISFITTSLRMYHDKKNTAYYNTILNPVTSPWRRVLQNSTIIRNKNNAVVAVRLEITDDTPSSVLASFCIASRIPYEFIDGDHVNSFNFFMKKGFKENDALYLSMLVVSESRMVKLIGQNTGHFPVTPNRLDYQMFVNGKHKERRDRYRNGDSYEGCSSIFNGNSEPPVFQFLCDETPYCGPFPLAYKNEAEGLERVIPTSIFLKKLKEQEAFWKGLNS